MIYAVFNVTEICNNGKEITFKKIILIPEKINNEVATDQQRLTIATKLLQQQHFYNLEFLKWKKV